MQASVGDQLHVHGRTVGENDHVGQIVEVRGADGTPPYLVRYPDGRETLVFPGPDAVIETPSGKMPQRALGRLGGVDTRLIDVTTGSGEFVRDLTADRSDNPRRQVRLSFLAG